MTGTKNDNRVFVFAHYTLKIGGIEVYLFEAARWLQQRGYRVMIFTDNRPIDPTLLSMIDSDKVQISHVWTMLAELTALMNNSNAHLTIYAFRLVEAGEAQKVRNALPLGRVDVFYCVPNFKGLPYYYEDAYSGKKKEKVRQRMASIFLQLHANNQIRYFSHVHITEMCGRYGYTEDDKAAVYVPKVEETPAFDEARCRRVWHSDKFNMLTISRFDFPHKGFIIGLIREYAKVKVRYPRLCYTIVGYGPGEQMIREEIARLDPKAQEDIHLEGRCAPEKMKDYFDQANLNISLAGCFSAGVRCSTLSLPARHFTYEGEVYGFLPESRSMTMSAEPGMPASQFIEQAINMDEETYVAKCKAGYDLYIGTDPSSSLLDKNSYVSKMEKRDIDYMIRTWDKCFRRSIWQGRLDKMKEMGIMKFIVSKIRR